MRKFLLFLMFIVIFTLPPMIPNSYSATTCVVSQVDLDSISRITWVCTGASGTGTASKAVRGWVYDVDVTPGGTGPTVGSGFTLVTSDSNVDVMGANASAMFAATPTRAVPLSSGWVNGTLSPVISNNIVATAVVTIRAWIWKQNN